MIRWFGLLVAVAAITALSCGADGGNDSSAIADRVLRIGEGVGTEVEIFNGAEPDDLDAVLNPDGTSDDEVTLPPLPDADLVGSARVTRADGLHTFFVMYELDQAEETVSEAARSLFDESPWQIVGGQSSEGVSAYRFQSTRSGDLVGTVVVQPLPATDTFKVVVERDGDEETLTVDRHAFTPVLGAEIEERDGGAVVARVGSGSGASAGLEEDDRLVRIGDQEVNDLASVSSALRALGDDEDPRSSVIYIMQISPASPIVSPFVEPEPRTIPSTYPAPYLVRDGSIPVAIEWTVEPAGSAYQILFLTRDTLADVADGYREILRGQGLNITLDEAQGTATNIEFSSTDNLMIGTISIDTFAEDDAYTEATVQVQAAPGFSPGTAPGPTPTVPAGSPTAPAGPATPTSTP